MEINRIKALIYTMSDKDLEKYEEETFNEYLDVRKTLDEQMIVNKTMYANHYLYEARVLEAKAKFLYVKAEIMTRERMKTSLDNLK
jgi:hypothetical protein